MIVFLEITPKPLSFFRSDHVVVVVAVGLMFCNVLQHLLRPNSTFTLDYA